MTLRPLKKILVIRFSSIGDIVLTTPVVRCLKNTFPQAEIHFLTKKKFAQVLAGNPYIDKLHLFDGNFGTMLAQLRNEHFDFVADLHHNLRSLRFKLALRCPSATFPKLNLRKWWYVHTKRLDVMPNIHIVDRYFDAVKKIGVKNDNLGLDFFTTPEPDFHIPFGNYIAIVCGATYTTKQIPLQLIYNITRREVYNFVLLGDKSDGERLDALPLPFGDNVFNACGKTTLNQSALMVKNSDAVITSDTGLMHIAAALDKKTVAVWGNTTPQLGMHPYMPQHPDCFVNIETAGLPCRPCSKLGYNKCPKGHLNCLKSITADEITAALEKLLAK